MTTLTVPAVMGSLHTVTDLVARLAADAGLTPDAAYRLRLATEELLTNVIRHGYGDSGSESVVRIESGIADDKVWVRLIDTAAPFDPATVPDPAGLDLPLHQREPGSLGLYLVRDAVDDLAYEYAGGNRTTVAMARNREGREPGDVRDDGDRQRVRRQH
jgi:serine/threonine-protein kinase RsbW